MVHRKSTKLLHDTLVWRREIKIESMKAEDCMKYIDKGLFYIYGWDDSHKPIIVARKRQEPMNPDEVDPYFKFIMFSLEQVQKSMPEQAHQWVQLLDLNGYSKKNAPPVKMGIAVINAFANHFPERLAHCYVIDAPTIFWVLYTAVWPFVDPVTRAKVHFVYTKDYKETGERKDGNEDSTRFSKYYKAWATQFDKARYMKILEELG
ncbi:unnamed protein product [Ostreobium quekettii]|uniref:CRAL-TRIO domain-containing protein n=1 Tax=Ostreobium quekettii TaxID=121088 RepID=A0A8S1J0I8_9CHLO|nr:unnamed protein product [Ostreobium quekettii]